MGGFRRCGELSANLRERVAKLGLRVNADAAPCAGCWADEGLCTVGHCLLPCANPTSAACAACSEAHCFPACVACSGLPRWAFPP